MAANTGQSLGAETWRERCARQAQLVAQTERMADALERCGVPVRQPSIVMAVGDVTGCVEAVAAYRAIRLLPVIAQRDRAPMLTGLRYFLANDPIGRHTRMAVVTSGERVPLSGNLRARQKVHTRRISRWASEARRLYDVEVLFRGTEFTLKDAGLHLHSHVLYAPLRRLPAAEWSAFLTWTKERLGTYWQDNGRLEKPEEAVKYPFKPAELEGQPDAVLGWLHEELFRLKLMQPMGAFAAFLRELELSGEKLAMVHQGKGRGAQLRRILRPQREPAGKASGSSDPLENVLLTRMLPQSRFCPHAEPVSLVAHYTPTPKTTSGRLGLFILRERTREARALWDANGAPEPAVAVAVGQGQAVAEPGHADTVVALHGGRQPRAPLRSTPVGQLSVPKFSGHSVHGSEGESEWGSPRFHVSQIARHGPEPSG
jgi:hypothetical protein